MHDVWLKILSGNTQTLVAGQQYSSPLLSSNKRGHQTMHCCGVRARANLQSCLDWHRTPGCVGTKQASPTGQQYELVFVQFDWQGLPSVMHMPIKVSQTVPTEQSEVALQGASPPGFGTLRHVPIFGLQYSTDEHCPEYCEYTLAIVVTARMLFMPKDMKILWVDVVLVGRFQARS